MKDLRYKDMNQSERRRFLIRELIKENKAYNSLKIPESADGQKQLLRALMNVRFPHTISDEFLKIQDEYLKQEAEEKKVTDVDSLMPVRDGLYIWQGDITALKIDAIVNAANGGMTGCYVPNHRCIDNCIHTYAGIQLRNECAEIMKIQGHEEPAGKAKLTAAYNLPCRYILHTVGPVVGDQVTENDRRLLASCYRSCLELAAYHELNSVAFCCISTGEFHFPNYEAARIAIDTVCSFMNQKNSVKRVVFNVFKDIDKNIYEKLLR